MSSAATLDKIVALCKRRGFVYQSAEIYGGINGVYDFGPLGTALKNNIRAAWLAHMQQNTYDIVLMEGSLLAPEAVWKASGHIDNFSDPMVDCLNCKKRYREDELDMAKPCPHCGIKNWTEARQFNLMFKTNLGAMSDGTSVAYLRPETAQAIFVNFKNVLSTTRVKIPFGIAQIGKAFRNEITPKQFLFRMREFEQMEMEFFCHPNDSDSFFEKWLTIRNDFYKTIGLTMERLRFRAHSQEDLAHYSKACTDVEYEFPFGWKELEGIAHRGAFDLTQHSKHSGKELAVHDEATKTSYIPHVVECSVGADRLFLTLLFDAYCEDVVDNEARVVLKLHPKLAPITVALLPLTKHQSTASEKIYLAIKQSGLTVLMDESGSIGKRYRRYDEIGTPFCVTYDYDSDNDNQVTVRHRDSTKQERISIDQLIEYLRKHLEA